MALSEALHKDLKEFLDEHKRVDLLTAYLFYLQQRHQLDPVLHPQGKMIYSSPEKAMALLEKEGKVWREAQIRITFSIEAVNERTRRVYICPFCGKVYGDNTHPNAQDAIYDHVSKCPENRERAGGLPTKRFFISEDPDVIKSYIKERKEPITKTVYSSATTGKLFNSKESVVKEFKKSSLKPMTLMETQAQNRFEIEPSFLEWLQDQLQEEKIAAFVEALAEHEEFMPYVGQWVEVEE